MIKDLGVPQLPFQRKPSEILADPLVFYDYLIRFDHDVLAGVWKYYFTLDEVIPSVEYDSKFSKGDIFVIIWYS